MRYPNRVEAKYYGAAARDVADVLSSTSGGVASVFARKVIADGGVVFGAAFDPFPYVRHIRVEDDAGIERIKGSKYVESDIKDALKQVKQLVNDGRKVLFVGLPCQVAALYGVLGGDNDNLITADLVCHGKPPRKLFEHWINHLQVKCGQKVVAYWFRNKSGCKWDDKEAYQHHYKLADGTIHAVPMKDNWYARYFLGGASLMEGCYRCPFARLPRVADITLGDFWGARKDDRLVAYADKGVSFVSSQSQKGVEMIGACKDMLQVVEVSTSFATKCCYHLTHCSSRPIYRSFVFCFVYLPERIRRLCDLGLFGSGSLIRKLIGRRK